MSLHRLFLLARKDAAIIAASAAKCGGEMRRAENEPFVIFHFLCLSYKVLDFKIS